MIIRSLYQHVYYHTNGLLGILLSAFKPSPRFARFLQFCCIGVQVHAVSSSNKLYASPDIDLISSKSADNVVSSAKGISMPREQENRH
jgi:hypothetical protein